MATGKTHRGEETGWQGKSPEDIQAEQQSQLDGQLESWASGKPLDPVLKVNVFACPVHDSKQQFPELGNVLLLRYIPPPQRRHEEMER